MTNERFTLIKNLRLIDPIEEKTEGCDLLFCKKNKKSEILKIEKSMKVLPKEGVRILNAHGSLACPAFTDLRCALPEQKTEYRESTESLLLAAAAGGYAHLLCRPVNSFPDNGTKCTEIISTAKALSDCRVSPVVPLSIGGKGEKLPPFELLREKGALAIGTEGEKNEPNGRLLIKALEESKRLSMLFVASGYERSLSGSGVNRGDIAAKLNLEGDHPAGELLALVKALLLSQQTDCPIHFPVVTLKKSVDLIRQAKKEGVPITCATAPPYFSLNEQELLFFGNNARLCPPLRSEEDRLAVIEGLCDGTIDCICSDHTPLSKREKTKEGGFLPGAVGLETAFAAGITYLVLPGHLSLYRLLRLMSIAPAGLLGQDARVKEGAQCNLALIDTHKELVYTGHSLFSHSFNTPFYGTSLWGRVTELYLEGSDPKWKNQQRKELS